MLLRIVIIWMCIVTSFYTGAFAAEKKQGGGNLGLKILQDMTTTLSGQKPANNVEGTNPANPVQKEDTKEEKIFKGVSNILASQGEMDYDTERVLGERLALEGFKTYGLPVYNYEVHKYVNMVGLAVARNSKRPGLPYRFVVLDSPLMNAFACPGGIVFISSGLVKSLDSEAELAALLGHELAHVGYKHAMNSMKRAKLISGIGQLTAVGMDSEQGKQLEAMVGNLQDVLFDHGLDQDLEYEADLRGMEAAYRTGYNPEGMIKILDALKRNEGQSQKELSWYSTHPPTASRLERCNQAMGYFPDAGNMVFKTGRFEHIKQLLMDYKAP